jgi:hypothetical protein
MDRLREKNYIAYDASSCKRPEQFVALHRLHLFQKFYQLGIKIIFSDVFQKNPLDLTKIKELASAKDADQAYRESAMKFYPKQGIHPKALTVRFNKDFDTGHLIVEDSQASVGILENQNRMTEDRLNAEMYSKSYESQAIVSFTDSMTKIHHHCTPKSLVQDFNCSMTWLSEIAFAQSMASKSEDITFLDSHPKNGFYSVVTPQEQFENRQGICFTAPHRKITAGVNLSQALSVIENQDKPLYTKRMLNEFADVMNTTTSSYCKVIEIAQQKNIAHNNPFAEQLLQKLSCKYKG